VKARFHYPKNNWQPITVTSPAGIKPPLICSSFTAHDNGVFLLIAKKLFQERQEFWMVLGRDTYSCQNSSYNNRL
jgi:hypothetical protein